MNTIKFEKGNVGVVAHRGLSGIERENTASAFVAAGNRSYYGIETGENSFGYIAGWSQDKALTELRASLETISKTSSELITDIDD